MLSVGTVIFVVHQIKGRIVITPAKIIELIKRETETGVRYSYCVSLSNETNDIVQISDTDIETNAVTLYTDHVEMKKALLKASEIKIDAVINTAREKLQTEFVHSCQ